METGHGGGKRRLDEEGCFTGRWGSADASSEDEAGVPAGSVCLRGPWCRKHDRAQLGDPGGVSGRVYLCLLF